MNWTENKILLSPNKYTPCKDIFQATCDEIGMHYEKKGFKYSKSRPKITYNDNIIKLDICFYSSSYNTPGEFVNLEILPHFYSVEIAKNDKYKNKFKGFLFGHTAINTTKLTDEKPHKKIIKQIFDEEIELFDENFDETIISNNHNCNIYNLTNSKFQK